MVQMIFHLFLIVAKQWLQNNTSTTTMLQDGRVLIGGVSDRRYSGNRRMIAMIQYG